MVDERRVAAMAAENHGVLLRDWLLSAGVTPHEIKRRLRQGAWVVLHQGVYGVAGAPVTWQQRLHAAELAAGHDAAVSHRGAIAWWGLDGAARGIVEIAVPRPQWPRLDGVLGVHRATDLYEHHVVVRDGIRVTKPARTLVDFGAVAHAGAVGAAYRHAVGKKL